MFVTPLLEKKEVLLLLRSVWNVCFLTRQEYCQIEIKCPQNIFLQQLPSLKNCWKKWGQLRFLNCVVEKKAKEMEPKTFQRFVSSKDDTHVLFFVVGLICREVDENKKNLCLSKVEDVISRSSQKLTLFFVIASILFAFLLKKKQTRLN